MPVILASKTACSILQVQRIDFFRILVELKARIQRKMDFNFIMISIFLLQCSYCQMFVVGVQLEAVRERAGWVILILEGKMSSRPRSIITIGTEPRVTAINSQHLSHLTTHTYREQILPSLGEHTSQNQNGLCIQFYMGDLLYIVYHVSQISILIECISTKMSVSAGMGDHIQGLIMAQCSTSKSQQHLHVVHQLHPTYRNGTK